MNPLRALLLALLAVALAACATGAPRPIAPSTERTVVLVGIDGFRPDYLDRGITPTLSALAANGVVGRMRPAFPTITFPNHVTLVTGVRPDAHGIIGNTMSDPALPGRLFRLSDQTEVRDPVWWAGVTPIWALAERQGVRTATMFWPGSDVEIGGVRPSAWLPYDKAFPAEARVAQVLAWLDRPAAERPRLVTLYFEAVDVAGHAHGPDAAETNAAIAATDAALGALLAGLEARGLRDRTDLIVVSDHGMTAVAPERIVWLDDHVPPDAVRVETNGPLLQLFPQPGRETEVEAALLGEKPRFVCRTKAEMAARYGYGAHPRVPPIVCLAERGWWIGVRGVTVPGRVDGGAHGYDDADPEMASLFLAAGPSFRRGAPIEGVRAIDVQPLLVRLLGLSSPQVEGETARTAGALAE